MSENSFKIVPEKISELGVEKRSMEIFSILPEQVVDFHGKEEQYMMCRDNCT